MAARVNTKFILILIVVLGIVGGTFGVLQLTVLKKTADDHVAKARELLEKGDVRRATYQLKRAVVKDPTHLEALELYEDATLGVVPQTPADAGEYAGQYMGILMHRASHFPSEAQYHLRALREISDAARTVTRRYWSQVHDLADDMNRLLSPDDAEYAMSYYFRALAILNPNQIGEAKNREIKEAIQDLDDFLEARPDDLAGHALRVSYLLSQALDHHQNARKRQRAESIREVEAALASAAELGVSGFDLMVMELQFIDLQRVMAAAEDSSYQPLPADVVMVADLVDRLEQTLTIDSAEWRVSTLIMHASRARQMGSTVDPVPFVERYLAAHDSALYTATRFAHYLADGPVETSGAKAKHWATYVLDYPLLSTRFACLPQWGQRKGMATMLVSIAVRDWGRAAEENRDAAVAVVEAARERLAAQEIKDDDLDMIYASGQVAYVNRDFVEGARLLSQVVQNANRVTPQMLLFYAICLEETGAPGLALQQVERAVRIAPKATGLLTHRVRLLIRMRRFPEAVVDLEKLVAADPDNTALAERLRGLHDQVGRGDIGSVDDPVTIALTLAQESIKSDDFPAALRIVDEAIAAHPDHRGLVMARIQIMNLAGDNEGALAILNESLAAYPSDRLLLRQKAYLESDDLVDAINRYYADLNDSSLGAQLARFGSLDSLARSRDAAIKVMEEAGDQPDELEVARGISRRARADADAQLASVMDSDPEAPAVLDVRFAQAVRNQSWDTAEEIVEIARRTDADKVGGRLFEGRLAGIRGDIDRAVEVLKEATEEKQYSSTAWNDLGRAYRMSGDLDAAIAAYRRGYEINPNDVTSALAYAGLLDAAGERLIALQVVRTVRTLIPGNEKLYDQWLDLEERGGFEGRVLSERRKRYARHADDITNAGKLAIFLFQTGPTMRTLLDAEQSPRYTPSSWSRLSPAEQAAELDSERIAWNEESRQIIAAIEPEDSEGAPFIEWAMLNAERIRAEGQAGEAQTPLREAVGRQVDAENKMLAEIALGDFQVRIGAYQNAARSYSRAIGILEDRPEPLYQFSKVLLRLGRYGAMVENLEAVIERLGGTSRSVFIVDFDAVSITRANMAPEAIEFQTVEAELNAGLVVNARARYDRVFAGQTDRTIGSRLLDARVLGAEADGAWERQDLAEMERLESAFSAALDEVLVLAPKEVVTRSMRALRLIGRFERTGTVVFLNDALESLAEALKISPDNRQASRLKVIVLRAQGNERGAVGELRRMLETDPFDDDSRADLIRYFVRDGRSDEARQAMREAIELYGRSAYGADWRDRLGNLEFVSRKNLEAADRMYREAWEVNPTPTRLGRIIEVNLAMDPPKIDAVLGIFRSRAEDLQREPVLRGWYGHALQLTGRDDQAEEQVRLAYAQIQSMIDAKRMRPSDIRIWFPIAARAFGREQPERVGSLYMKLSGNSPTVYGLAGLAAIWSQSGDSGMSRAIELQRNALEAIGDLNENVRAALLVDLAGIYISAGRPEDAITSYEEVLAVQPRNVQALNNYAFLLADLLDRAEEALPHAELAVIVDPQNWTHLDTLGWTLFKAGQVLRAEKYLRQSIGVRPEPGNHRHLAEVFRSQKRWALAQRHCERAAELLSQMPDADPETQAEIDRLGDDIRNERGAG